MKKLLALLLVVFSLAAPAGATWSIVVVNTQTGEVGVASATCLSGFALEKFVPVIVVGKGGGAAQSYVDFGAINRLRMWNELHTGSTPAEILTDLLDNGTNPHSRQYGIAAMTGPSASWSGPGCWAAVGNVTGQVGDFFYAIQGNVLTGDEPVLAAELAFVTTEGDMGQRMMAAMEGARSMGGDGRCSCAEYDPTGCGAPPAQFDKTAHCGFVYVARIGDTDGGCDGLLGCASGDYYLQIDFSGVAADPDPVFVLQDMYNTWRADLVGRPDHLRSTVTAPSQAMPADGTTQTTVTVSLVDVDGIPLTAGGALVSVALEETELATVGAVTDHGNGTYSFPVTAGISPGTARFAITADDGVATATLYPYFELDVDPVTPLHCARDSVYLMDDTRVTLTMNVPEGAGRRYLILASASGIDPGIMIGELLLPLNPDEVLWRSIRNANNFRFLNTMGRLDGAGRAEATFTAPPGLLSNLLGLRLDWAALYFDGELAVTPSVGFSIFYDR